MTEYTSNPVISLYLSVCSGGSWGEARRVLWVKKVPERRKVGRASKKKNRVRSLAKGVDPSLVCITEALLASAVSCRMITVLISADRGKKAGLASRNIVHLQKIILSCVGYFFLYVKPIRSSLLIQRKPAG